MKHMEQIESNRDAPAWKERAIAGLTTLVGCRYETFRMIQEPPYRSLNNGATGIAYTLWKAACVLDDPQWLHHARLWIDHIIASPQDERMVGHADGEGDVVEIAIEDSLYHGDRGVQFVKMLIAYAQADDYHLNKYLRQFEKPSAGTYGSRELMQGTPGRLTGFSILYDEMGYDYLRETGNALAGELLATVDPSSGTIPWGDNHYLGIAHGRGGILYSLLFWSKVSAFTLPDRLHEDLKQLATYGVPHTHGLRWPVDDRGEHGFLDGWCHGNPGLLHLWALAYRQYGDLFFLETARHAGEYLIHREAYPLGHICCGAAGASYGLLALHGIDPGGPWLDGAVRYAVMADRAKPVARFRLGLYTGLAGVVCLMLDLMNPDQARQPGFQG